MNINPFLLTDFYKVGHVFQYPKGTQYVYSNMTPRASKFPDVNHMVFFGLQYFIQRYLIDFFNENFFELPKNLVLNTYKRQIKNALGSDLPTYQHIADLHDLGMLPLHIKALPEGTLVPMRVPCLTIVNTMPEFYWLTNFIETLMSSVLWQPCTSATIAYEFRKLLNHHAKATGMAPEFVQWQGHDFSFRGMSSPESAITSGMAHLLSFTGTDSIPAIDALEQYYGANSDKELIGGSVPATEHSVMCAGGQGNEIETIRRLITEVYPTGIVSIVSDTWDLWKVLTEYLPALKSEILARDGKVVIRPDSGDPADIICGYGISLTNLNPQSRGVIQLLWDVFGGIVTSTGHRLLDSHVGAIYGDSITRARADEIGTRLAQKGFASQVVLGIGSYAYQYNTRDTFGIAIKATNVVIDEVSKAISKDPVTDDGTKKSASGLLCVVQGGKDLNLMDNCTKATEQGGLLRTIFKNGRTENIQTLQQIRNKLHGS